MNFWNSVSNHYESMSFIIGIASFFLMLATWRLARLRHDDNSRLETVILSSWQWGSFALFAGFNMLAFITEFIQIHFDITIAIHLQITFLTIGYLFLFESARVYFKKYIKLWIYLILITPIFIINGGIQNIETTQFLCTGILPLISCSLFSLTIYLRLRNLNLMCTQLRGVGLALLIYGISQMLLSLKTFAIMNQYLWLSQTLAEYHFPLSMISLVIFISIVGLIVDHFGYVRDRFLSTRIKTQRARIRHVILFIAIITLSVGSISADIAAGYRRLKIINHTTDYIHKVMPRIQKEALKTDLAHVDFSFDESVIHSIDNIRIFKKNILDQWEVHYHNIQEQVPLAWAKRFEVVQFTQREKLFIEPVLGALSNVFYCVPIISQHKVGSIMVFTLSNTYLFDAENSIRIKVLLSAILISGIIILIWLLYSLGEDRRVLINTNIQQFNQLFKQSQTVEMLLNPATGGIVDANTCADTFFGMGTGGLKNKNITELHLTPIDMEQSDLKPSSPTDSHEGYFLFSPPNQSTRHVQIRTWPILFLGEELSFCTLTDITPYVTHGKRLQEKVTQLEELFDSLPFPAYLKDSDRKYIMVNESFARIVNKNKHQIIGMTGEEAFKNRPHHNIQELDQKLYDLDSNEPQVDHIVWNENSPNPEYYNLYRKLITWEGMPKCIFGVIIIKKKEKESN